ncbi:hypothetical protein [Pyruvatibacter mobilis]|uniref:hypothetical protein n=1 Tax=Pyruvatibacter mobilis TaxID=1712261 RepID=UPI003D0C17F0
MSKAAYASIAATIAAGASRQFDVTGTFVRCFTASHTDFVVRIDDDPVQFFDQGVAIQMAEGERFTKIEVVNKSASSLEIELGYGAGLVTDNRLSLVGGSLPVKPSSANTPFKVDVVNTVQVVEQAPVPIGPTSYTTGSATAGTSVIVPAGANTNGIRLTAMRGLSAAAGTSFPASLMLSSTPLFTWRDNFNWAGNLLVPAGVSLEFFAGGGGESFSVFYEVL